ncbi:hypothetical protein P7D22_03095 [Lichenihabitans sp. Uapishka_5]|uniref:hypothetical protein n=1 Tax=Lichenihabitans sp. Uapishka_5 TaxID=3037302 RepID=UPI0029E82917|nr:hypothetical protein [Lichenihabitans sp. Uapishka_5]MDX7950163.1 hypothetical protein [Lichenihabitans sp. Uapishka_5]
MHSKSKKLGLAGMAALVLGATLASTAPASAFGRHGFYRGGHRGLGVGAAVGVGLGAAALGAVAASAASERYNGYPVYRDGTHPAYGYDYYPDHGGYYGPY